jgi:hypothetical protein
MLSPLSYGALYVVVVGALCYEWWRARGVDRVVIGAVVVAMIAAPIAGVLVFYGS